ncbi:ring-cleaving dioxygenase [Silvibacterium dinghuense]|uniref:Ring-cleaving dioxygenase n=1 Tax=Silvibacterium dinghuense TaxID=1560006 RepID=A0A4Q1SFS9_9BACT|nr:ring-cleaving dioxygenase [Silvibacterium dinghuense]RXS96406.1 ring-cleaving dioxygenase [Silvibacterium dinghuense]GGG90521.1 diguanylate cyclase [Silvibacterium dinghuense]
MPKPIAGLHHVTAIASQPQQNLDFYREVLGLRLVKRTVNFDDPGTYHFYFGDDTGTPGTILTFFPWPRAARGQAGAGEVSHTAFSVPVGSLSYWRERLATKGQFFEEETRFGSGVLVFPDPDGMRIEIVEDPEAPEARASRDADVPAEHALRGFFGVTLLERNLEATSRLLEQMGFAKAATEGDRVRFTAPGHALGRHIDLKRDPNANYGHMGAGTVHHIAFRTRDDEDELVWRGELARDYNVTPVLDRTYFHSIYFREPGGVLFELATDPPGFLSDEPVETLGQTLKLPEWLEKHREEIEQRLPAIKLGTAKEVRA